MEWLSDKTVRIDPPKRPKKITGTRFAAIMGLNAWTTPFKTWCEITKTYVEPFEETIYTRAGKVIEPKQAEYMKRAYFMPNLQSPTDKYGPDYFQTTYGDFFPDSKIFGGMWDYLLLDEKGKPTAVLEMKTTKRSEDWAEDIPQYYALQAALYAHLLGVDDVIMVASFLEDKDYDAPENFIPSAQNTIVKPFKVSERYPKFSAFVEYAESWWQDHVEDGISPQYDEQKDKDVLKELRTKYYSPETDTQAILDEIATIVHTLEEHKTVTDPLEKRLKTLKETLKKAMVERMGPYDKQAVTQVSGYTITVTETSRSSIDKNALLNDGLLEKYTVMNTDYKMTIKEDKSENHQT